jgi:hypothetical protein
MAKAPTYQELNQQKADALAAQDQKAQQMNVAQETQNAANANMNPVLAQYMQSNTQPQGLTPSVMDEPVGYGFTRRDLEGMGVPLEYQDQLSDRELQGLAAKYTAEQNNTQRGLGSPQEFRGLQ